MATGKITRRRMLQTAGAAAAALGLPGLGRRATPAEGPETPAEPTLPNEPVLGMPFEARDVVRVGLVGCGRRGLSLLNDLLGVPKVEVMAVCDVVAGHAEGARDLAEKRKAPRPDAYTRGERHYEELARREDLDLVYIATPWRWHVRMAVACMDAGKHAAVEVPAAVTLDECWTLVEASERTRRHCVMLENCCYGYEEMLVNRMVKAGLLGDLLHAECAYDHDLREILFENDSEGLWRRAEHVGRNGNLYPTHGLGPVAWYLGIHRGDRFERLVSMSSPEAGLSAYREARVPKDDARWQERYDCGDVNTSLIRTSRGRTIVLQHGVANPRPYDRINLVAGTKGIFRGYPPRVFLDGQKDHKWAKLGGLRERHEDPLWRQLKKAARRSGHGGMDYVMTWRLVDCMRRGLPPDMDVYDAAAWSAPGPLSEMSVAAGSAPVAFPDFTRGRWKG